MQQNHFLHLFEYCPCCGSSQFRVNNIKSKKCNKCGFVYYFNISASTAAFITDESGRLLVAKRANEPAKGTFDLPGGFVDSGETAEEAITREVKEETGLIVNNFAYCFSIPNVYVYSGFDIHTLDLFFEANVNEIAAIKAADDVSELLWMKQDDIEPEQFGLTSIKQAISKWLALNNKVC